MSQKIKPLFIFELANNHNGKLERGIKIIDQLNEQVKNYRDYFDFAVKLQYRNLDTFIHPEYKNRNDIDFIKKFNDAKLLEDELFLLKQEIKKQGFISICTAFDEDSVDLIESHGYDFIKIASCSFCDWSLLNKIATKSMPIIASTAGIDLKNINKVVEYFLTQNKELSLLHCVAEYPTKMENLELNQIDLLKNHFPQLNIGYSSHELPINIDVVKMAIAKGAVIFEKHVGLDDSEGSINSYSVTPEQVRLWLKYAKEAFDICGVSASRYKPTKNELESLQKLSRGVFAAENIMIGQTIDPSNTIMAIPSSDKQCMPSDFIPGKEIIATANIAVNLPILTTDVEVIGTRAKVTY